MSRNSLSFQLAMPSMTSCIRALEYINGLSLLRQVGVVLWRNHKVVQLHQEISSLKEKEATDYQLPLVRFFSSTLSPLVAFLT